MVLAAGDYASAVCVHSPYSIPRGEYLSDSPSVRRLRNDFVVTAPEIALQPVAQEDASKVGKANSCFATSITTPTKKVQPQVSHSPRSSSFRNLSSSEVRYKFREREKVKSLVPTKSDAKNHDPALAYMASGRRTISD